MDLVLEALWDEVNQAISFWPLFEAEAVRTCQARTWTRAFSALTASLRSFCDPPRTEFQL